MNDKNGVDCLYEIVDQGCSLVLGHTRFTGKDRKGPGIQSQIHSILFWGSKWVGFTFKNIRSFQKSCQGNLLQRSLQHREAGGGEQVS